LAALGVVNADALARLGLAAGPQQHNAAQTAEMTRELGSFFYVGVLIDGRLGDDEADRSHSSIAAQIERQVVVRPPPRKRRDQFARR
jgi:hypothetical protein